MVVKADQDRVRTLLKDTITLLCKNGLAFDNKFSIEAVIGVTIDDGDVFLVSMNELIKSEKALLSEKTAAEEKNKAKASSPSTTRRDLNNKRRKRRHKDVKTESASEESESSESDRSATPFGDNDTEPLAKQPNLNPTPNTSFKEEVEENEEDDEDIVFIKEEPHDNLWQQRSAIIPNMDMSAVGEDQNFSSLSDMNLVPVDDDAMWGQSQGLEGMSSSQTYAPRLSHGSASRTATVTSDGLPSQDPSQTAPSGSQLFTCELCWKQFNWKRNYKRHMNSHYGKFPYHCKICSHGFYNRQRIIQHMFKVHPDVEHTLRKCTNVDGRKLTQDAQFPQPQDAGVSGTSHCDVE